jgi:S-adenosylmethionine synthetase family protein
MKAIMTSESVTEGHLHKVCDFIADSILDAHLAENPDHARRLRGPLQTRHRGAGGRNHVGRNGERK